MTFAERLKIIRERHELSRQQVAERLKISLSTVARWEQGAGEPGPEALSKLADLFQVSTDFLIGRDEIRQLGWREGRGGGFCSVLSEEDAKFLSIFRELSPVGKEKLLAYADDLRKIAEYKAIQN